MPGEVGVFMKRDFIFFDFLNHEDVLYRGNISYKINVYFNYFLTYSSLF